MSLNIDRAEFAAMGMDKLYSFRSLINAAKQCNLDIAGSFGQITTIFNSEYEPVSGQTDYFLGNSVKNNWFSRIDQVRLAPAQQVDEAYKYILCKELGDTLQAYYGKLYLNKATNKNQLCLFTNDNVLTLRCRLFEVPVVVIDRGFKQQGWTECYYYPAPGVVTDDVKQFYLSLFDQQNRAVVNRLSEAIRRGSVFINNKVIVLTQRSKAAINNIRQHVDNAITDSHRLDSTYYTIDEYVTMLDKQCANHLVDITANYVRLLKEKSVFNDGVASFGNDGTFYEYITRMNQAQSGGFFDVDNRIHQMFVNNPDISYNFHKNAVELRPDQLEPLEPYTKDGDEPMDATADEDIQLKRALYLILRERFPQWSKHKLQWEVVDIYYVLFGYFRRLGAFTTDRDFLNRIIDALDDGSFDFMTHEQFCDLYYEVRNEKFGIPRDDPDPILTSFIKEYEKIMEWEKDVELPTYHPSVHNAEVFAGGKQRGTRRRVLKKRRHSRRLNNRRHKQ